MRELKIPKKNTNPIHNDVRENTIFLLFHQNYRGVYFMVLCYISRNQILKNILTKKFIS